MLRIGDLGVVTIIQNQIRITSYNVCYTKLLRWFWVIVTTPRSPMRSIMHWMAGLTLFWLLLASLWMPWIDYGKTYRDVSASLKKELPAKLDCVAGASLPLSFRASLDYFEVV